MRFRTTRRTTSKGCWRCSSADRLARSVLLLGFTIVLLASPPFAQGQEPTDEPPAVTHTEHSPRGALWRAAAVPGWGQVYNRQYLKVPAVYAGLGLLIANVIHSNNRYLLYRHAYLYATQPEVYPQYANVAARFSQIIDAGRQDLLRQQRDVFRRNRDLSYIGIGLFHGLSILDAYVSAHLRDFDIDEDLSVRIDPIYAGGPGIQARFRWQ